MIRGRRGSDLLEGGHGGDVLAGNRGYDECRGQGPKRDRPRRGDIAKRSCEAISGALGAEG